MQLERNRMAGGFTLVESLIGIFILAIGMSALYTGLAFGFKCVGLAREERRATQILLETTETLRLYTWDQLHDPSFLPSRFTRQYDPLYTNEVNGTPGVIYTGQIAIASSPTTNENYSPFLNQVTVTLDWQSMGLTRHREITTLVTSNGLQNYVY